MCPSTLVFLRKWTFVLLGLWFSIWLWLWSADFFDSTLAWKDCLMGPADQSYANQTVECQFACLWRFTLKILPGKLSTPRSHSVLWEHEDKTKTTLVSCVKHIITWLRRKVWLRKPFGLFKSSIVLSLCEYFFFFLMWGFETGSSLDALNNFAMFLKQAQSIQSKPSSWNWLTKCFKKVNLYDDCFLYLITFPETLLICVKEWKKEILWSNIGLNFSDFL